MISAEEVQERTYFYWNQGYRVVWVVDVSKQVRKGNIGMINGEYNVYNWRHATKMFDLLPLIHRSYDDMRIALYWEDCDNNGWLDHIVWTNRKKRNIVHLGWDAENIEYDTDFRPDLRIFAVGKKDFLNNGIDAVSFFYEC